METTRQYVEESRRRWQTFNDTLDAAELSGEDFERITAAVTELVDAERADVLAHLVIGTQRPDGEPELVPFRIGP